MIFVGIVVVDRAEFSMIREICVKSVQKQGENVLHGFLYAPVARKWLNSVCSTSHAAGWLTNQNDCFKVLFMIAAVKRNPCYTMFRVVYLSSLALRPTCHRLRLVVAAVALCSVACRLSEHEWQEACAGKL